MAVDWTKPIQFESGDKAELIDCKSMFRNYSRVVRMLTSKPLPKVWHFKEDGISNTPGFNIINA